jgi:hypothetical protein
LDVVVGRGVEADVDSPVCIDSVRVLFHSGRVEHVELRDLGRTPVATNETRDLIERPMGTSNEVHGSALASVGSGDRRANRSCRPVDDCRLFVE